jgi:hypothetical protein
VIARLLGELPGPVDEQLADEARVLDAYDNVLPVPAEILIHSQDEWEAMRQRGGRFVEIIERETVWL